MIWKKIRKGLLFVLSLLMILGSFSWNVEAAPDLYKVNEGKKISGTGVKVRINFDGNNFRETYWADGLNKLSVEGETVFCIEPLISGFKDGVAVYDNGGNPREAIAFHTRENF